MKHGVALLVATLAFASFAGCIGGDDTVEPTGVMPDAPLVPWDTLDPVRIITDAAGDATEWNGDAVRDVGPVRFTCDVINPDTCDSVLNTDGGGVEAAPFLDILSLDVADTPDHLVLRLEVAYLPEDMREMVDADADIGTYHVVGWSPTEGCTSAVFLEVQPVDDGLEAYGANMVTLYDDCPTGGDDEPAWCQTSREVCTGPIGLELIPGTPGVVMFQVPRTHVPLVAGSPVIETFGAFAGRGVARSSAYQDTDLILPDEAPGVSVSGDTPPPYVDLDWSYTSDYASGGPYTLTAARAPEPSASNGHAVWTDDPVGHAKAVSPTLDLVQITVRETARSLVLDAVVGQVLASPTQSQTAGVMLAFDMALPSGESVLATVEVQDGGYVPSALWRSFDPETGDRVGFAVAIALEVVPGSPGHLIVTLDRSTMPPIEADAVLRSFRAYLNPRSDDTHTLAAGSSVYTYTRVTPYDFLFPDTLFRFVNGSTPAPRGTIATIIDARSDVERPVEATGDTDIPDARFDITRVEAEVVDVDVIRVSLGIADLSAVQVPRAYDAAFYAAAVPTDDETIMFGFYKTRTDPVGDFFCAQDVTVLAPVPQDPRAAPTWLPITGGISALSGGDGESGVSAVGGHTLTFDAPLSCFGAGLQSELATTGLGAVVYLLRGQGTVPGDGGIHLLDRADSKEPTALSYAAVITPQSFWVKPFGVDNFWDMFGAALAMLTVLGTAIIVWRRRHRFKGYLARIDDAVQQHAEAPETFAAALQVISSDLEADLRSGRLPTDQYGVVQTRLRHERLVARVDVFATDFRTLPVGVVKDLERYLLDGVLSSDDRARILAQAKRDGVAAKTLKEISGVLDRWVAEDRGRGT